MVGRGRLSSLNLLRSQQLLVEKTSAANAVVDHDVGNHDDRLSVVRRKLMTLLGDELTQQLDGVIAVRLPEPLIGLSLLHCVLKPCQGWSWQQVEPAFLQEDPSEEIVEIGRASCRER